MRWLFGTGAVVCAALAALAWYAGAMSDNVSARFLWQNSQAPAMAFAIAAVILLLAAIFWRA